MINLKWLRSGVVILVESISLLVSYSQVSANPGCPLRIIACIVLAAIILAGSYMRVKPVIDSQTERHTPPAVA